MKKIFYGVVLMVLLLFPMNARYILIKLWIWLLCFYSSGFISFSEIVIYAHFSLLRQFITSALQTFHNYKTSILLDLIKYN